MTDELPSFRYHPDPLATGSVIRSSAVCRNCGRERGYIYRGPVVAEEDLAGQLCPWCIADGSAAERLGAEFVDPAAVGDYGAWSPVPSSVAEEVARRTPGFTGWQQERWWTHCGDAAEYLGRAGHAELVTRWAAAAAVIRADAHMEGERWDGYLRALHAEGSPTAYVFRCRHCGQLGGYSDSH